MNKTFRQAKNHNLQPVVVVDLSGISVSARSLCSVYSKTPQPKEESLRDVTLNALVAGGNGTEKGDDCCQGAALFFPVTVLIRA